MRRLGVNMSLRRGGELLSLPRNDIENDGMM